MATLFELAQQTEPGDNIKWVGEKSDVDDPRPRTVTRVILEIGRITIEAEGPRGADVQFEVEKHGPSKATYQGQNQGEVDWAELVDKGISTRVQDK